MSKSSAILVLIAVVAVGGFILYQQMKASAAAAQDAANAARTPRSGLGQMLGDLVDVGGAIVSKVESLIPSQTTNTSDTGVLGPAENFGTGDLSPSALGL